MSNYPFGWWSNTFDAIEEKDKGCVARYDWAKCHSPPSQDQDQDQKRVPIESRYPSCVIRHIPPRNIVGVT